MTEFLANESAGPHKAPNAAADTLPKEELWRADLYDLLAALLARPPSGELLAGLARLEGDRQTEIGRHIGALARLASATGEKAAEREYNALFIGLGRGELLAFASFYLTGFLNEQPLARLRRDMARLGIAREEDVHEPEDNIATLCEIMAGLIRGRFGAPATASAQREFFTTHLEPWAEHFFTDLEKAGAAVLYAPVGSLGRAFMKLEAHTFRMIG